MQQRRTGEPRHQRCVLDWIPEPEAAPAELVIGPVRAAGDAECQAHPGAQYPGPHPSRPRRVDTAFEESGDRKGKRDRKTDIAEIEHRGMEGEARVLQDRVEIASLEWRVGNSQERIR